MFITRKYLELSHLHIFMLTWLIFISTASGLQCYSCKYERVVRTSPKRTDFTNGNISCKDLSNATPIMMSSHTLKPCNNESDSINFKETQKLKQAAAILNEASPEFHLGCIKLSVHKISPDSELELVIRGCYAKRILPKYDFEEETIITTPPPPPPPVTCALPLSTLWQQLREGHLDNSPLNTTSSNLKACICDTMDGCNSAGKLGRFQLMNNFITLMVVILTSHIL